MVKMVLGVEGMMCHHCEAHVNDDISEAFEVESVVSDHEANTTTVVAAAAIAEDELKKVIDEAGYKLTSYSCEEV
ncbi:cation transporter [Ruminococcus sp.]|uniref:heavy-metal-associated domain-containing protein n=1 Tax=Ruminococcus sp. TaxID=41978 RepID=UPI0025F47AEB|nr:cation transporter [Ruminococcus sp.]MBQ8965920.1 cation transporter [Ruminococcus sp.]